MDCDFCNEDCAEDVDCEDCGRKFWIRSCLYGEGKKPWPTRCVKCKREYENFIKNLENGDLNA